MKCPYRMNEVHTCHDGKSWVYKEFAECYKELCPYWGAFESSVYGVVSGCRKVEKECLIER